jgi:hypothetical protein
MMRSDAAVMESIISTEKPDAMQARARAGFATLKIFADPTIPHDLKETHRSELLE